MSLIHVYRVDLAKDVSRLHLEVQEKKIGARNTYRRNCKVESHSVETTSWRRIFSYSQSGN